MSAFIDYEKTDVGYRVVLAATQEVIDWLEGQRWHWEKYDDILVDVETMRDVTYIKTAI
jgi:hypothetical protein